VVQGLEEIDEVIASLSVLQSPHLSKDEVVQQKLCLSSMQKPLGASSLHLQDPESSKTHFLQFTTKAHYD